MSTRTKLFGAIAGVAVLIVAAAAAWFVFIRDDAPEEVSLASAVEALSTPAAATSSPPAGATPAATTAGAAATPAATTGTTASSTGINGTWTIDTTVESFAGYRVKEELARIGATTAVGRTRAVTGTAVLANNQLMSVTVTADLTKLASDSSQRDGQLRNQGIETSKFPTATFTLTNAMAIPAGLANGQQISTTVVGTLELHGVKKAVEVPVQATITNGYLVIVGSLDILFSDYNVTPPSAASVLTIEDRGIMELQLFLKKG